MSRLRDLIASADDIQKELVPIPEWGCDIEVRGLNGTQRAAMLRRYSTDTGRVDYEEMVPPLVVACSYDPEDESLIFTEDDVPMLLTKAAYVIERVSNKALVLSGLDNKAEEKVGKPGSGSSAEETPKNASTSS